MSRSGCICALFVIIAFASGAQAPLESGGAVKINAHTGVKNQANSGTCWSFSMASLLESEAIRNGTGVVDISEMFNVRNIYLEKARNYILRQGAAQFGSGGLGHDVINAVNKYGAVPENVYSGLLLGQRFHDHNTLDHKLKLYLDSLLKNRPVPANWIVKYQLILDDHLGKVPETFVYNEKEYTPKTFATEFLKFKRSDFVFLTSFTHHPFYAPFILEIPDNYANESYYNVPLNELISIVNESIQRGFTVMWNTDVSNNNFRHRDGYALVPIKQELQAPIDPDADETMYDQVVRQQLFESLTTQDDHLMHIVGTEKTKKGKTLFVVKNSWGETGPFKGYVKVSETYFALNTMTIILPKAALSVSLKGKLGIGK